MMIRSHSARRHGFTLVEISVAIVIISLLVGSVIVGNTMLRNAKLRSIMVDKDRYVAAVGQFQQVYKALPGDMINATSYWGEAHATPANCEQLAITTTTTDKRTCNGDGDGHIFGNAAAGRRLHERFRFWQHLSNAGLIEGNYLGVNNCGSNTASCYRAGTNSPLSEILGATWALYDVGREATLPTHIYDTQLYRHILYFGVEQPTVGFPFTKVLTPKEAWSLDSKFDDGTPAYGKVTVLMPMAAGAMINDCATTNVATTAAYKAVNGTSEVTTPQCIFLFPLDF